MLPFKTLIPLSKNPATPVYRQIANGLVSLIRNGIIKPGSSLPPGREMAAHLQVHRKTIVAAYEELNAQDWIEIFPRKGVWVSNLLPDLKPRTFKAATKASGYADNTGFTFQTLGSVSSQAAKAGDHRIILNDGFPDARIAPLDLLFKEYRDLLRRRGVERSMMYGGQAGSMNLRAAIAQFLSETRGISIRVENVLTSHGAQMAIFMAARIILKPGSTVIVGEPNYFMANMIFEQFGAKLIRVPVDDNGIDVNAIEKICKKKTNLVNLLADRRKL